jgi:hypothetical protein
MPWLNNDASDVPGVSSFTTSRSPEMGKRTSAAQIEAKRRGQEQRTMEREATEESARQGDAVPPLPTREVPPRC